MRMEGQSEQKNKRIAFLVSAGIHASLFLTFFFLISWRAPYPPAPEYGVELNFGLDTQGGGDIQPTTPVGSPNAEEKDADQKANDQKADAEPVKEVKAEAVEKNDEKIISDETSEVAVKAKKDKPEEKVKEKAEVKKDKPVEVKPVVKQEAIYTGAKGEKKGETNQSQGDDPGKVGDKGDPRGLYQKGAFTGNPGGGDNGTGFGLAMSGWKWASQPKAPDLPDNENGTIEFEIVCDENGEIEKITTINRGLSLRAEQLLKAVIQKNSLERISEGKVPLQSKGRVVFVLRTK
jgi:outer membrane biosynthesis protein TonB